MNVDLNTAIALLTLAVLIVGLATVVFKGGKLVRTVDHVADAVEDLYARKVDKEFCKERHRRTE